MEQAEQVEWDGVNKLLQRRGFKAVRLADPAENKNLSDLVLLDRESAGEIRVALRTMLADSDRRQNLIQELVKSNNQLKEEAREHTGRAARQSERAAELEGLLAAVKGRVQDLEDRCLGNAAQQHGRARQLQQEKREALERCSALERKLSEKEEEAARLQRRLYVAVKEEERRAARQSRAFRHICGRVGRQSGGDEQQVLAVIDFYETRMAQLLEELRSARGPPQASQEDKKAPSSVSPSFRTILKAFQEQQKESKSNVEELKREVERLKRELKSSSRPAEGDAPEASDHDRDHARRRHLLDEIGAVVSGPGAPRLGLRGPAHPPSLLPTLEMWARQLHLLEDLQRGLHRLAGRLMPWQSSTVTAATVEDMTLLVDSMLENTAAHHDKAPRSPTPHTLASMVSHFQRLFDVGSLSGVYPRMNELYTRLGEMSNAMRNLREVLELDSRAPPAQLVSRVARLVADGDGTPGPRGLLGDADIDSVIVKVRQHEEFFPAFHGLITEVLRTLGVSRLDDILPALTSLKEAAAQLS